MASGLIERVRMALPQGFPPLEVREVAHCELAVHTSAGYAFFRVIEPREDVVRSWQTVQDEIARFLRTLSARGQYDGAYLALLVEGEQDPVKLQRIAANAYVCRKVVVPHADRVDVGTVVAQMPFFPLPDSVQRTLRRPPADPGVVIAGTGLKAALVENMLERRKTADVLKELLRGDFDAGGEAPTPTPTKGPGRIAGLGDRFYVRELCLSGFRNYGGERDPIKLPGNLIVIFGRNGTGKTSLCEALEWTVTGLSHRVERTSTDEKTSTGLEPFFNLKHPNQPVAVEVLLDGPRQLRLRRSWAPGADEDVLTRNGVAIRDRQLLADLSLLTVEETLPRVGKHVQEVMQACHFLSQDTIQDFLTDKPEERYRTYLFMAGTQHLDRLVTKGQELLVLIDAGLGDLKSREDTARGMWEGLWKQREDEKSRLEERVRGEVPDLERTLSEHAQLLVDRAAACGLHVMLPALAPAEAAQVVAETFLAGHSARVRSLKDEWQRLGRLHADAALVPEWLAAEVELSGQIRELEEHAGQVNRQVNDLQREASGAQGAISVLRADLDAVAEQAEPLRRYVIAFDTREAARRLRDEELDLPALREQVDRAKRAVAECRGRVAQSEAELKQCRNEAEAYAERVSRLQRVAEQLPSWRNLRTELIRADENVGQLNFDLVFQAVQLAENEAKLHEASRVLRTRERALKAERREVESRQELLAALKSHLQPGESRCPFCGEDHHEHGRLVEKVEGVLAALPGSLHAAETAHAEAVKQVDKYTALGKELAAEQHQREQERAELLLYAQKRSEQIEKAEATLSALGLPALAELTDEAVAADTDAARALKSAAQDRILGAEARLKAESDALAEAESQAGAATAALERGESAVAEYEQLIAARDEELKALPYASRDVVIQLLQPLQDRQQAIQSRLDTEVKRKDGLLGQVEDISRQLQGLYTQKSGFATELDQVRGRLLRYRSELAHWRISGRDPDEEQALLAERVHMADQQVDSLDRLVTFAQQLLFEVKTFSVLTRVSFLETEMHKLEDSMRGGELEKSSLEWYRTKVEQLVDQTRKLMAEEEQARLEAFRPMIQLLYQRLNSHPYFGDLDLDINAQARSLFVRFKTGAEEAGTAAVNRYFSMAQANAVALSIFLGTALLQAWSRLGFLCLDDPVQHMDDLNMYALLDLLNVVSTSGRQVIVTTANEELYRLMLSRFGGANTAETTQFQAFRLVGITAEGPEIYEDTPRPLPASVQ